MRLTGLKLISPLGTVSSAPLAGILYSPRSTRAMVSGMVSLGSGTSGSIWASCSSRAGSKGFMTSPSMVSGFRLR